MKILKGLVGLAIVLILAFVVLSFLGPKDYEVERSKEINASAADVYNQVVNFENWESWSAWREKDPGATYNIIGEDGKVGTKQTWKGDKSGEGSMEILEALPNEIVSHILLFTKPFEAESKTRFEIESIDSTRSKLTWRMTGKNEGAFFRVWALLQPMDNAIGPDFERGLFKLDSVLLAQRAMPAE
jgi:hypothetical protein